TPDMEALAIRDDGWPRRSGAACHLASVSGEQFYDRGRGVIAQDDLGRLGQVLAPQLLGFLSAALADELDEPGVGAQRDLRELLLMLPVMAVRPHAPPHGDGSLGFQDAERLPQRGPRDAESSISTLSEGSWSPSFSSPSTICRRRCAATISPAFGTRTVETPVTAFKLSLGPTSLIQSVLTSPRPEGQGFRRSPAGVPVSPPAARPGRLPGRSDASSAGKHRQPGGSDVDRGVDIPVMPGAAVHAFPLADAERQARSRAPAGRADLAGGGPAAGHHAGPPVPFAFVRQHGPHLPPCRVRDRAGQVVVADHVPHAQVLD